MIAWTLATLLTQPAMACEAFKDVTVHLPDGPHAGWDVVWEGDRLTAVGPGVAPASCQLHRGDGLQVTAGLVSASGALGLVEIELEASTRDDSWSGDEIRAAHQVALAYNPRSTVVPITRLGGISAAITSPQGGLVSGQSAAVRLVTGSRRDALLDADVAVVFDPGALGSHAAGITRLRELLDDARYFDKKGMGRSYTDLSELSASRLDLAALVPVAQGRVPLLVKVDRASDLEAVLDVAASEGIRVIVHGGAEAWLLADRLASERVPVFVDPFVYGAGGVSQTHGRPDNAALLDAAGVEVGIVTTETHNARSLRFVAGNAVRGGLPHAAAIDAITRVPAEAFGLKGRGVVEAGAFADLAVWTGDPLEIASRLHSVWIGGVEQSKDSRQTELIDAWRRLPRPWFPEDLEPAE